MFLRYRLRALALALGSRAARPRGVGLGRAAVAVVRLRQHHPALHRPGGRPPGPPHRLGRQRRHRRLAPGLYAAPGGLGAKIDTDVPVNPGETLQIDVGGRGGLGFFQTAGDGATAGGSARRGGTGGTVNETQFDGTAGGGGGGATTVSARRGTTLLVAGGGGGGGGGGALAGRNGGQGGDAGATASGSCEPNTASGHLRQRPRRRRRGQLPCRTGPPAAAGAARSPRPAPVPAAVAAAAFPPATAAAPAAMAAVAAVAAARARPTGRGVGRRTSWSRTVGRASAASSSRGMRLRPPACRYEGPSATATGSSCRPA